MMIENILLFANLAFFVILTGIALLVLHKVRRVHLMSYQLVEDAAFARKELESLFSQIQALIGLEKQLKLDGPLPPMRGWAASPDFLLTIASHILRSESETVFECSSGTSTVVVARCLQLNGKGHVYSLEHDPEYAKKTRELLQLHGLEDWATVIDAPLEHENQLRWYSMKNIPHDLPSIDVLIVDGPPSSNIYLARYPALPRLYSRLSNNCSIFVDDANRPDEQEIVRRWTSEYQQLRQIPIFCEKGAVLLYRRTTPE